MRQGFLFLSLMMCFLIQFCEVRAQPIDAPTKVGAAPANESVMVRLPDGTLKVFYIHRPEGTTICSITSTDNGRTWSQEHTEFSLPGTAYYGVQVTLDRHGEFQVVFHILGKGDKGYNGRHYDLWHVRSSDGRTRWGEPKRFFEGYVGSLRGFTTLKSGRLFLSVSIAIPDRVKPKPDQPDFGWNDSVVFYSDDEGATWVQGKDHLQVLQDASRGKTRYGAVEPHVCELLDGRVWMLIRTKNGHLWESFSSDGGVTWPQPVKSRFISSDSPATTIRLKDNRLVLLLNACQKWDDLRNYAIGGRHVLHAAISSDDGTTWCGFREILRDDQAQERGDRGTSYASGVETADGKLLVASGQGDSKRALLLLDPNWIDEKSATDDFSKGDSQWTSYEGKGAAIITHPEIANRQVMEIRKVDPTMTAGAIWNFPAASSGTITLKVRANKNFKAMALSLTDHYCVISDSLADQNSVYALALSEKLSPDAWHEVQLRWKADGLLAVSVDGANISEVALTRKTDFGVNYLRLRSLDEAGFVIDSVSFVAQ